MAPKRKFNSDAKAKMIVHNKFTNKKEIPDARTINTHLNGKCKGIFKNTRIR